MLSDLEARVLDAIDIEAMLSFLSRLIAVQSVGGEESAAQDLVAAQLAACGLEVDRWEIDLDSLRAHPAYAVEIDRETALGVVGSTEGDAVHGSLILNGHVDVVPAGDLGAWSVPPWRATLTDRRVYGRGAVDMKGGLCCALFAARALRDAGCRLRGQLVIQSVVGEEDGGLGTLASIVRGHRADAAIILEPTQLTLVPVQAGALTFRLTVEGRAAHGALRNAGVSAVEKFQPLLESLQQLEAKRQARARRHPLMQDLELPCPISVGKVVAGLWPSSVPEKLIAEGRYGLIPGESSAAARQELESALLEASSVDPWLRDTPPIIEWWGGRFEPAEISTDEAIVQTVGLAVEDVTGVRPPIRGVPYGADSRLLIQEAGIPTLLFGPGDVRLAHSPDEFVPIDDLILTVRTVALTCLRSLGVRS